MRKSVPGLASAGVPVPEMVAQRRAGQEPPFHPGYTAVVVEVVGGAVEEVGVEGVGVGNMAEYMFGVLVTEPGVEGEEPRGTTADEAAETEGSKAKP